MDSSPEKLLHRDKERRPAVAKDVKGAKIWARGSTGCVFFSIRVDPRSNDIFGYLALDIFIANHQRDTSLDKKNA